MGQMNLEEKNAQRNVKWSALVEILQWRAALQADQKAYTFLSKDEEELSLTYAQLDRQARALGAMLQWRGAS